MGFMPGQTRMMVETKIQAVERQVTPMALMV